MAPRRRRQASLILASLGALLVIAGGALTYTGATLSNSREFSDRATGTLETKSMRAVVARRVTAQLVAARPNLIAVRPLVEAGAEQVVGSAAFRSLFRGG